MLEWLQNKWPEIFGVNIQKSNLATSYRRDGPPMAEPIKSVAVISAPGVKPQITFTLPDGQHFGMLLDGPALFNLNQEVTAAIGQYLNFPYKSRADSVPPTPKKK